MHFNFNGDTTATDIKIPQAQQSDSYTAVFMLPSINRSNIDTMSGRGSTIPFIDTIGQEYTNTLQVSIPRKEVKGYSYRNDLWELLPYVPAVS